MKGATTRRTAQLNVVLAMLTAICGLWLMPSSATACTCMGLRDQAEAFERSDAVFIASVAAVCDYPSWYYDWVELIDRRFDTGLIFQVDEPLVHLEVEASWKGITAARAVTRTSRSAGGCGYPFDEGCRYLIYAAERNNQLVTGVCWATKDVANSGDDLDFLEGFPQLALPETEPLPKATLCKSHWKRWWLPFGRVSSRMSYLSRTARSWVRQREEAAGFALRAAWHSRLAGRTEPWWLHLSARRASGR